LKQNTEKKTHWERSCTNLYKLHTPAKVTVFNQFHHGHGSQLLPAAKLYVDIKVNEQLTQFQLDSASDRTVIEIKLAKQLASILIDSGDKSNHAGRQPLRVLGSAMVNMKYGAKTAPNRVVCIDTAETRLLGLNAINVFGMITFKDSSTGH